MKFELNTEKTPFCTIGQYAFTFASPDHDIDLDSLSSEHKKQLMYNLRRGMILTDEKDKIQEIIAAGPAPRYATPAEVPLVPARVQKIVDPIGEDLKLLTDLLRGNVDTIRKETRDFTVARLRKLHELEGESKNRNRLMAYLEELLNQHRLSVNSVVVGPDIGGMNAMDPKARSTQVGDIVESEEEQFVLSQDVLNQLGD